MKELDTATVELGGSHLVEASAGCGKTHAITELYVRLVAERRLDVSEILVVTYTRAATAELRERIREKLRVAARDESRSAEQRERLAIAVRSFDEAAIFTIHGFCQRALTDNAFESRVEFGTELVPNLGPMLLEVVQDFYCRELHDAPKVLVRWLRRDGPEKLVALARAVTSDPDLEVLPAEIDVDLDEPLERWRAACAEAREIWERERATVIDLLARHDGLHRSTYKEEAILHEWPAGVDAALSGDRPGAFGKLGNFTTSTLADKTRKHHQPPSHPFFDRCEEVVEAEAALIEALDAHKVALEKRLVAFARHELEARKAALGVSSYDDLLHRLRDALASDGGHALIARLRDRYRAALIDEFQDTDPVQYEIFRRVFRGAPRSTLFLIGDPKQAIYAFRGADVFAYLRAASDGADERHTLSTSWRSDPALLRALNTVFGRAARPFLVEDIEFRKVSHAPAAEDRLGGELAGAPPFELLMMPSDDPRVETTRAGEVRQGWAGTHLPRLIASEIARLLARGGTLRTSSGERPIVPGDVAVLCRTNAQAGDVQTALRELGVPAVLEGDRSVFEQDDAEWMERLLEAMASPRDARHVRAALATPIFGVSGNELDRLNQEEGAWESWLARFDRYHRVFRDVGFIQAFQKLLDGEGVMARLLGRPDGERRLTNLLHLAELLHDAAMRGHLGPQALVRWLEEMRRDESSRGALAAEAAQIRLESDAHAVRLTTIHRSKGLEYPIVYCPFLWDGTLLFQEESKRVRFHDASDGHKKKLDLGSADHDAHLARAERESLAESLRLLYVALTRAKHRCSVVWGRFQYDGRKNPALGYVLHGKSAAGASDLGGPVPNAVKGISEERLREDLQALAHASEGAIAVRDLSLEAADRWAAGPFERAELASRPLRRRIDATFRVSSFSGLVSSEESEAESFDAVVGHDHAGEPLPAIEAPPDIVLHDFPAGPKPGLLLHEIYESIDFASADGATVRAVVERLLLRYGYEGRFVEPICRSVRAVLDTPLDQDGVRLADVPARSRVCEMELTFPVRDTLTPERLAAALLDHGLPEADPGYARRLARLSFRALRGQLRGFIDLVFEHGGRYYVVDYKSNHLGTSGAAYAPERLRSAMADHHYYLQYLIYTAALHRHLRARLPGYDYDRHVGGVRYLFLRGMSPDHPGRGVFRDRPSRASIEALCALLDPEGA